MGGSRVQRLQVLVLPQAIRTGCEKVRLKILGTVRLEEDFFVVLFEKIHMSTYVF